MILTPDRAREHGRMLENRISKNYKRLARVFRRRSTNAFRVYDWDIPEVRAYVDWYDGQVVVSELRRTQTDAVPEYGDILASAAASALDLPLDAVWSRRRTTGPSVRYGPKPQQRVFKVVREHGLKFRVNLSDYLDTGLFLDHRPTRKEIQDTARSCAVLNLFAYTGTFGVYAKAGGARSVTCVDLSKNYLAWAKDNFDINRLDPGELRVENVFDFLRQERTRRWDLVILDPPSFSTRWGTGRFDIQGHHRDLVERALAVTAQGGRLFFSTNHQDFHPDLEGLDATSIEEVTDRTVPEDFRNPTVHRCWLIQR